MTSPNTNSTFRPFLCLLVLAVIATIPGLAQADDAYPLDNLVRKATIKRGKVICPKVPMTKYRGEIIRYHSKVWVYKGFVERLKLFEAVVRDTAIEFYGRAPRRIKHVGTYNCRIISGWPDLISEHGIGNGIDVAGFDFPALPRKERKASSLPRKLKRSFKVRMKKHWDDGKDKGIHARFLDTLARRLVARKDIFRVLLGPSYPGHKNHFHFDMSPWRLVDIWPHD